MGNRRYAEDTSVSTDKSIMEIRSTVRRYGATEFMHMEGERDAAIVFTMRDRRVMFRVKMPDPSEREFTHSSRGRRAPSVAHAHWEQACRARWRALALVVKAKLESVASGIAEFDTEFMGNIVMPGTNVTIGDAMRPRLVAAHEQQSHTPLLGYIGGDA